MKSPGKIVYLEEELLNLRHFNQVDFQCRKLIENLLKNQENVHKQVSDGDKQLWNQLWRQVEFKLPPGSIILRIDPGMKIPEGAKSLETLLEQDGDEYFETYTKREVVTRANETTINQKQAWTPSWKGKLNQKHGVDIIGAKLDDDYQKFISDSIRTKLYKSNYEKNPYSRGFFPGYFTNLISRSYNPYSRTGFYPSNSAVINNHTPKPGSDCDSHSTQSSFDIEI